MRQGIVSSSAEWPQLPERAGQLPEQLSLLPPQPPGLLPPFAFGPRAVPAQMHMHGEMTSEMDVHGEMDAHGTHARTRSATCNSLCDCCCKTDRATGDTMCVQLSLCCASSAELCGQCCAAGMTGG